MSLDWNVNRIKNHESVCFEKDKLRTVTESLIFATMSIGIPKITSKTAEEFYRRLNIHERMFGAWRRSGAPGDVKEIYFTEEEIQAHVGLETNACPIRRISYLTNLYKRHERECKWLTNR